MAELETAPDRLESCCSTAAQESCCAPDDIMLEGPPTMNRGLASAQLTWHPARISVVGGGGEMYQSDMPADLAAFLEANTEKHAATL